MAKKIEFYEPEVAGKRFDDFMRRILNYKPPTKIQPRKKPVKAH